MGRVGAVRRDQPVFRRSSGRILVRNVPQQRGAASPGLRVRASSPCAPRPSATARSRSRSTRIPSRRPASCSSASGPPGLNGADMLQLKGLYPPPPGAPPDIPGLELAGEVVALGRDARRFEVGDRVMAVVGGGGQGELAVVHERAAMPVPEELDWTAAGGVPEAFTTAHDALFTQAGLEVGERVLVHGAAGGVGHRRGAARHDGGRARHRDGARSPRARGDHGARRQRDRARGLHRARAVRRHPRARRRAQPRREPRRRWPTAGGSASSASGRARRPS